MRQTDIANLIDEVEKDLEDLLYGSVELHVQEGQVTQVTVRRIKKTGFSIHQSSLNRSKISQNLKLKTNGQVLQKKEKQSQKKYLTR